MPVIARDPQINVVGALRALRNGSRDPTTRISPTDFWRATRTPDGPATIHLSWTHTAVTAEAWGEGAEWVLARVAPMCGLDDPGHHFDNGAHPVILGAQRNHPGERLAASGTLYHELLPAILGHRVTAVEATRQWRQLCLRLGQPAPGPDVTLRLPPDPVVLATQPAWWFHPFGIEAKRANALRVVARHAERIEQWSLLSPPEAMDKLQLLPGIGMWTANVAGGAAFGDPDAVPVGDYHIPNLVAWSMTRAPRGNDEQMLALLEPYSGQRARVLRLLSLSGARPPKFGPRQRIQPMHRR